MNKCFILTFITVIAALLCGCSSSNQSPAVNDVMAFGLKGQVKSLNNWPPMFGLWDWEFDQDGYISGVCLKPEDGATVQRDKAGHFKSYKYTQDECDYEVEYEFSIERNANGSIKSLRYENFIYNFETDKHGRIVSITHVQAWDNEVALQQNIMYGEDGRLVRCDLTWPQSNDLANWDYRTVRCDSKGNPVEMVEEVNQRGEIFESKTILTETSYY